MVESVCVFSDAAVEAALLTTPDMVAMGLSMVGVLRNVKMVYTMARLAATPIQYEILKFCRAEVLADAARWFSSSLSHCFIFSSMSALLRIACLTIQVKSYC